MTFYISLIFIIWKLISGEHVSTPQFIMFIIGSGFRILSLNFWINCKHFYIVKIPIQSGGFVTFKTIFDT